MFSHCRDIFDPLEVRITFNHPLTLMGDHNPRQRTQLSLRCPQYQQSGVCPRSLPKADKNKFQIMLNVNHFETKDIEVKTVGNFVVVHGKHEEQVDEHGYVSREFTRRYQLPDDVEPSTVTSSLSTNCVLTIQAPRKSLEPPPKNERIVPIFIQQSMTFEESEKQRVLEQQVIEQEQQTEQHVIEQEQQTEQHVIEQEQQTQQHVIEQQTEQPEQEVRQPEQQLWQPEKLVRQPELQIWHLPELQLRRPVSESSEEQ